jgi:membrane protein DedA with SNARE-associated domain
VNVALLYVTLAFTVMFQEEAAPIAGALAAHHGHGQLPLVILACAAGTYVGDLVLYGIGRRTRTLIARPRFRPALSFIRRHPKAAPLAVRFAYGLRFTLPVTCGAAGLPFASYALWVGVSAALWATAFGLVGWEAGELALRLFHDAKHHELPLIGAVLLVWLTIFVVFHLRGRHADVDQPDAAGA